MKNLSRKRCDSFEEPSHPMKSRKEITPSNIEITNLLDRILVKYPSGFNDGSDKEFMLPRDTCDILEDEEQYHECGDMSAT
ncbi:hypothetical protein TNCV_878011 [Trichonephila clavipes]|nr:hypothetical protein TNCV_878011 [Trichonephila clavipes]